MLNISVKDFRPLAEKAVCAYARNVFSGFFTEDDLNELISEVTIRLWQNRGQYDENRGAVSTWSGRIARNMVLDAVKSEKRRRAGGGRKCRHSGDSHCSKPPAQAPASSDKS